ncbi:E3 ubiquitin-protein ligase ORTHRUS 2 [Helianthus annuus]|uniref:E3 ubiquitin-protein ligase ORTHRUS 2 n=1 Tax=Helianthus annuus TaxID=4232 RepID=UPI000B8F94C8|nr:E3 ubiquitin-protein ligase ORTHRUS 2 [Helianthus annuus]
MILEGTTLKPVYFFLCHELSSLIKCSQIMCNNGYRSAYEPENGFIRFDGAYRIEKCWRKSGIQGRDVWRYLFVRCDNYPAAWTSDKYGDRPRPLPIELQRGTDVVERKGPPYWDYDV